MDASPAERAPTMLERSPAEKRIVSLSEAVERLLTQSTPLETHNGVEQRVDNLERAVGVGPPPAAPATRAW
jgi:hypothetical protein